METIRKITVRSAVAPLAAAALLVLGGCSSTPQAPVNDAGSPPAASAPAETGGTQSEAPEPSAQPSDEATQSVPQPDDTDDGATSPAVTQPSNGRGGTLEAATKAIETAEAAGNGTAVEVDYDKSDTWEIDVATGSSATEFKLSGDGASVVSQKPTDLDSDDAQALAAAKISMTDALKTALDEVPGTIDEAELEHHKGTPAYSVEVYPEDGSQTRDVHIDAATGQVIEVTDED